MQFQLFRSVYAHKASDKKAAKKSKPVELDVLDPPPPQQMPAPTTPITAAPPKSIRVPICPPPTPFVPVDPLAATNDFFSRGMAAIHGLTGPTDGDVSGDESWSGDFVQNRAVGSVGSVNPGCGASGWESDVFALRL